MALAPCSPPHQGQSPLQFAQTRGARIQPAGRVDGALRQLRFVLTDPFAAQGDPAQCQAATGVGQYLRRFAQGACSQAGLGGTELVGQRVVFEAFAGGALEAAQRRRDRGIVRSDRRGRLQGVPGAVAGRLDQVPGGQGSIGASVTKEGRFRLKVPSP